MAEDRDRVAKLIGEVHDFQTRIAAMATMPTDLDSLGMLDELRGEIRSADAVADVLWNVVAQGAADDADWFALARLITGQDDEAQGEDADFTWLDMVRPDLHDIADAEGKVSHPVMVQAAIEYVDGVLRLVAGGLPTVEDLFAEIDEVRTLFAAPPPGPLELEVMLKRVRDLTATRQLLAALVELSTKHPLLCNDARPVGNHEEVLATYRVRHRAGDLLARLREELEELPD